MMAKRQLSIVDFCNAKRGMQQVDDHSDSESESEPSISDSENFIDDVENEINDDDHSYCRPQCREACNSILIRHSEDLPQTAKLCEIALCIPISTIICERGFSLQNWLKSKFRNCLGGKLRLQNLMKICRGPNMTSFPCDVAVQHWYVAKKRRLGRLFKQSKAAADV
jgi:hypothetical protein